MGEAWACPTLHLSCPSAVGASTFHTILVAPSCMHLLTQAAATRRVSMWSWSLQVKSMMVRPISQAWSPMRAQVGGAYGSCTQGCFRERIGASGGKDNATRAWAPQGVLAAEDDGKTSRQASTQACWPACSHMQTAKTRRPKPAGRRLRAGWSGKRRSRRDRSVVSRLGRADQRLRW